MVAEILLESEVESEVEEIEPEKTATDCFFYLIIVYTQSIIESTMISLKSP